jgi:hypothetical protein
MKAGKKAKAADGIKYKNKGRRSGLKDSDLLN